MYLKENKMLTQEPFVVPLMENDNNNDVKLQLHFRGHYNEPIYSFNINLGVAFKNS